MYYLVSQDYLMHHGVKGMKWGVRRYQNKNGTLTAEGRKRYVSVNHFKSDRKYKIIRNVAIGIAAVSAAAIVGSYAYRVGLYRTNSILKAGKIVQNVAPKGRSFEESFYGTRDKGSAEFFKRQFTQVSNPRFRAQPRNTITQLSSEKDIKIAGRKEMDNTLKALMKERGASSVRINGNGNIVWGSGFRMTRNDYNNFWRAYGRLEPGSADRKLIEGHLAKKGFGGFKDYNDITIGWGNTPTVFFGKQSGLKVINQKTLSNTTIKQLKKNPHLTLNGSVQYARSAGAYAALPASVVAIDTQTERQYNDKAYKKYGKSYDELDWRQKQRVSN